MTPPSNGAPFTPSEYNDRLSRLRHALRNQGIAHALITAPDTIAWLCGFRSRWYRQHTSTALPPQQCLVVSETSELPVLVDVWYHEDLARDTAIALEFRSIRGVRADGEPTLDEYVPFLVRQIGLKLGDVVGMELWSCIPSPAISRAIELELTRIGAKTTDISLLTRELRRLKSPAEIDLIKRAQVACDSGIEELARKATPEMTELEAWATYSLAMVRAGGEPAALHETVATGGSVSEIHRLSGHRPLGSAALIYPDMAASVEGYHARATRPLKFGPPSSSERQQIEHATNLYEVIAEYGHVGTPWRDLFQAINSYCAQAGIEAEVAGYELGLSIPPTDWVGEFTWTSAVDSDRVIEAGFVTNVEIITEVIFVDTVIFTPLGPEFLSRLPRTILEVAR